MQPYAPCLKCLWLLHVSSFYTKALYGIATGTMTPLVQLLLNVCLSYSKAASSVETN